MSQDDHTLAYLLDLDGEEIVYDGRYVARFRVRRVEATPARPHGISYSLTFHAADDRRLVGYDNAHGVQHRGGRFIEPQEAFHWHRDASDAGRPYRFLSGEELVAGFFDEIERVLKEHEHG